MTVEEVLAARQPGTVIDVGAGHGDWLAGVADILPSTALLVGADLVGPHRPPARLRFVYADASRMPFLGNAVAAVTARAVLHHTPHPSAAVGELARLVAEGGCLVIRDATAMSLTKADELRAYLISRGHPPEPHAGLDPDQLAEAAIEAGLIIESLDRAAGTAKLAGPRFTTPAFELVASRPRPVTAAPGVT